MLNDKTDRVVNGETDRPVDYDAARVHDDLDIGEEQVSSNECWELDDADEPEVAIYAEPDLGEEQVTSNECYDPEEEE